jgi:two-component system LytT family response regulator
MTTLSTTLHAVLVEDSPQVSATIRSYLTHHPGFQLLDSCSSINEAIPIIEMHKPDVLLLDINLKDGTAFDLLNQVGVGKYKIIFITGHTHHAIRAIKFGALDYIVKPVDKDELLKAIEKAKSSIPVQSEQITIANQTFRQESNKIIIAEQDGLQIVLMKEIMYCHSDAGYTTFYLNDGRKVVACSYLKEYEALFGEEFFRPHQSYLVNSNYIVKYYKRGFLKLKNDVDIPVSVRKKEEVLMYLKNYIN